MDSPALVSFHVAVSLMTIATGTLVLRAMLASRCSDTLVLCYVLSSVIT